jgi:hypothetical protein
LRAQQQRLVALGNYIMKDPFAVDGQRWLWREWSLGKRKILLGR